ncbi:hypothetical protein V7056_19905 [Bacillus sp. JJ664]
MFVTLSKVEINSLNDADLCWACIEPAIHAYKQSKGIDFIETYYKSLSKGQQALFMYTVYFKHALNSKEEYYWWTAHLLMYRNAWPELKKSLLFFHAQAMIDHIERFISHLQLREMDGENPSLSILKNDFELQSMVVSSFSTFQKLSHFTTRSISHYIRHHVSEFVQLKNELN